MLLRHLLFGKGSKGSKTCNTCRADTAFRSTCQHDLGIPVLDRAECITNAMSSGSTGCHNICTFAAESELNGDISCCHVGDHHRYHQRIYFSRSFGEDFFIVILYLRKTSDTGANDHACAERIFFFHIDPGIFQGFFCCRHCILAERIHTSRRSRIHMVFCVKILHLCGNLYFVIGGIKLRDRSDADFSLADPCPEILYIISNRGNCTKSGDNDSSLTHMTIPPST